MLRRVANSFGGSLSSFGSYTAMLILKPTRLSQADNAVISHPLVQKSRQVTVAGVESNLRPDRDYGPDLQLRPRLENGLTSPSFGS